MNRTTLLVLALVVVVGGYLLISQTDEVNEPLTDVTEGADEPTENMAGTDVDDAGETTESAGDMPPEADATGEEAEPADDAAGAGAVPVEDTSAAGTDAQDDTAGAETDPAEDMTGEATQADGVAEETDTTPDTTADVAIPAYLTVEGFDAERAREAVDASDVGTVEKSSLQAAISAAEDDPALREQLLERLREALGF